MSFKENSKIYYGLDIGTDSVGWSTTNEKYELLRYKNNLMWGVSLFEAASLAEERRGHRTQRRRYDRRQQRVALLGELFAKEILKTDPDFFLRLKESSLYPEDRTSKNVNTYFDNIKSSLKSYLDFRRLLENGFLSENDVERIIERITVTTDKPRLVSWLKAEYSDLPAEDIRYISRLSYKDYGRLSAKLLTGCYELDTNTGEIGGRSIIDFMWAENINLMQILSDSYGYKSFIEEENKKYYMINPTGSIAQTLREMYVSPSVSRAIIRTMEIVKELRKITKKDPDKIFVEMARGGKPEEKGKRTSSRREQIEKLYDSAKAFVSDEDISHLRSQLGSLSDEQLRSEKYYLYFIQFGKCMYSGEAIDFSRLGDNHCYDIDHIFPQSKINDDSLHNNIVTSESLTSHRQACMKRSLTTYLSYELENCNCDRKSQA